MKFSALLGAAVAAVGIASSANGSVIVSIQPEGGDTANHMFVTAGQVVTLDVHVIVTGVTTTAGAQQVIQASGNYRSSNGGLLGNLSAFGDPLQTDNTKIGVGLNPYTASGSTVGTSQDADADTDLDLGKTTANVGSAWASTASTAGTSSNAGSNFVDVLFGKIRFTVGNTAADGALTNVTFVVTGGLINVKTDGVASNITSVNNYTQTAAVLEVAVPEPASMGVLALGSLALLARRRK